MKITHITFQISIKNQLDDVSMYSNFLHHFDLTEEFFISLSKNRLCVKQNDQFTFKKRVFNVRDL